MAVSPHDSELSLRADELSCRCISEGDDCPYPSVHKLFKKQEEA